MELAAYQKSALETSEFGQFDDPESAIPTLLGLAGEAGEILDVYKRYLRERIKLENSRELLREELGDLLWYTAVVAATFSLDLEDIAQENLRRTRERYGPPHDGLDLFSHTDFDSTYPLVERLPRRLVLGFKENNTDGEPCVSVKLLEATPNPFPNGPVPYENGKEQGFQVGASFGNRLTDNSKRGDAYRYHDAIHLGFMAVLGWSPTIRAALKVKRRSIPELDTNEDGARAIFLEEGLSATLAELAKRRIGFRTPSTVDGEVLDIILAIVCGLEVRAVPGRIWRNAISAGFSAMSQLQQNAGGILIANQDDRTLTYHKWNSEPTSEA